MHAWHTRLTTRYRKKWHQAYFKFDYVDSSCLNHYSAASYGGENAGSFYQSSAVIVNIEFHLMLIYSIIYLKLIIIFAPDQTNETYRICRIFVNMHLLSVMVFFFNECVIIIFFPNENSIWFNQKKHKWNKYHGKRDEEYQY